MDSIFNNYGKLCHHKTSIRGVLQDYIITFNEEECDIKCVIEKTYDLFEKLIGNFQHKIILCRLVANVNFIHKNEVTGELTERFYYFPSSRSEVVENELEFYKSHMNKIANRLEFFHVNGSNLQILNIQSIHIQLTVKP